MPRPNPHPLACFALIPKNDRAKSVLNHPENDAFISTLIDGTLALDIGHIRSKSGNTTLATIGRGDTDIFVEGSSIAKIQCSFEIIPATNVIMLYDRSHGQTTQVFGENSMPFENGRLRKVVVQKKLNTVIGMGGVKRNLVQFELHWHHSQDEIIEKIKSRGSSASGYEEHPRLARTVIDEVDTVLPSQRQTRIHTPGSNQLRMRYVKMGKLGAGACAEVYKALDVYSGRLMAVKILKAAGTTKRQQEDWKQSVHNTLKREVEYLAKMDHPHIVDYITSQGYDAPQVEIFMGLNEGNLELLIESGCSPRPEDVFHQMLQALDCLASADIIHRDVKPQNILWMTGPNGQYHFQLGDFGLCNRGASAYTRGVGTPIYMAPEVWEHGKQTTKADVWSLYVTMLWVLDVKGFRQGCLDFKDFHEVRTGVYEASKQESPSRIRRMANPDPTKRASAAEMPVECFNGVGLVTPRNQAQTSVDSPAIDGAADNTRTPAPVPTPAAPPTRTRTAKKLPLQKDANKSAAAARYRVEKARYPLNLPKQVKDSPMGQAIRLVDKKKSPMPGTFPSDDTEPVARKRRLSSELTTFS